MNVFGVFMSVLVCLNLLAVCILADELFKVKKPYDDADFVTFTTPVLVKAEIADVCQNDGELPCGTGCCSSGGSSSPSGDGVPEEDSLTEASPRGFVSGGGANFAWECDSWKNGVRKCYFKSFSTGTVFENKVRTEVLMTSTVSEEKELHGFKYYELYPRGWSNGVER